MRIGFVSNYSATGAGEVTRNLVKILSKWNYELSVYARNEGGNLLSTPADIDCRIWKAKKTFRPLPKSVNLSDYKKWLKDFNPDILIYNEQQSVQPILVSREMGIPSIAYVDYYKENTVDSFRLYDGLVCVTKRHQSVFNWHKNSKYFSWGSDSSLFSLSSKTPEFDFYHSTGNDPYRKGTDLLLESLKYLPDETKTLIHSIQNLEELLPNYQELIKFNINKGKLTLLNGVVEIPGHYDKAKFYVYPARLDGLGLTVTEALMSGTSVIVTDAAPMYEFTTSFGFKVPIAKSWARADAYYWPMSEVNPSDLATTMISSLEKYMDSDREACFKMAKENFNIFNNFSNFNIFLLNTLETAPTYNLTKEEMEILGVEKIKIRYRNSMTFILGVLHFLKRLFSSINV